MPVCSGGKGILLSIILAGVASFICLLWAVYHIENRKSHDTVDHLKSIVHFVSAHPRGSEVQTKPVERFVISDVSPVVTIPLATKEDLRGSQQFKQQPLSKPAQTSTTPNLANKVNSTDYEGDIYMDWAGDSDDFAYSNYKSLESLLTVYPRARVTVHLIAPNGAQYYKMGNLLSKHYFQKYLKSGYNVQTKIVFQTYTEKQVNSTLGAAYWNEQFALCCTSTSAADINKYRVVPAHMYFYLRFARLYDTGGMYADFSWYQTNPFHLNEESENSGDGGHETDDSSLIQPGAFISLSCYTNKGAEDPVPSVAAPCMTRSSALLTFPKHSGVLGCMLTQYNTTTSTLLRCIHEDEFSGGVRCVQRALADCFTTTATSNHLSTSTSTSEADEKHGDVGIAPSIALWMGHNAFSGDWTEPSHSSAIYNYIQHNPLVVPGPYYKQKLIVRSTTSDTIDHTNVPFVPYPLTLLAAVTPDEQQYIRSLNKREVTHMPTGTITNSTYSCAHYQYNMKLPAHMQRQASLSCAPHFVIPGYMKAGTTYLYATLSTHPLLLNTLRGVSFKETGCYGKQYVEGRGKSLLRNSLSTAYSEVYDSHVGRGGAASSGNMSALYREALHLLATSSPRYANRMDCFPFVETHERVRFGDGTVWYNSHKYIPQALLQDNPNMKVLFTIRNPVHRTQSQHRFYYSTIVRLYTGDLNEIIRYLLLDDANHHYDGGSLFELREQAVDILQETNATLKVQKTETLMDNFQKKLPIDKKYKMLNQFIKYSIYFVPVYYWYKYIPKNNIVVVPMEALKPNKIDTTTKLEYLYNLTTLAEYNTITEKHNTATAIATTALRTLRAKYSTKASILQTQVEDEDVRTVKQAKLDTEQEQQEAKIKRIQDKALNQAYLVHQYNRLFRFLELPEMASIADADSHETGDKYVLPEHKLSDETRVLLEHYFEPFNHLLEDFLEGKTGYS